MSRPLSPGAPVGEDDELLRVERVIQGGRIVNVIKDDADHIAFPGLVPEEIRPPADNLSPQSEPEPSATVTTDEKPPKDARPEKSFSDPAPLGASQPERTAKSPQRPSVDKKWRTELSGRAGGARARPSSFIRAPRRAETSYFGRAVRRDMARQNNDDGYSSSSSSSGDEESVCHARPGPVSDGSTPGTAEKTEHKMRRRRRQREEDMDQYRRFAIGNENYRTKGKIKKDGRLRISVKETANKGYLAKALGQAFSRVAPTRDDEPDDKGEQVKIKRPVGSRETSASSTIASLDMRKPRLNICIMVIGSRGDAQPFIKIGKVLKEQYGHRVRFATHPAFREFIEADSGLEFFSVGGDPAELMAFMVKNPGMIPTLDAVKAGDIGRRRAAMAEMFEGFWRACTDATDDAKDVQNLKMMGGKEPFVADAIIANPPSFAHMHCAEALGIPMHLMFTFPYTPTQAFPHPLASIKRSNVDPGYTNFISYPLVEMMVWQGLGDLVNEFRVKTLKLDPVSTLWAPGQSYRLHIPFSYLWSPGLVPKPEDWGEEIDISGFVFLDLASTFNPPTALDQFLAAGETPIYIGFGSIVVDDPDRFTQMIFDAVEKAGVRALLSKGWGGLGGEDIPDNIYMLENTPHDWLFPRIQACVIHGGAGTTAMALKCGKPTMVVPFFGDQHFWGSMLGSSGAGPEPVPYKDLNADILAEGIKYCLTDEARSKAAEIAQAIEKEGDGAANAVNSFHHHLTLTGRHSMRCSILSDRIAVWKLKDTNVRLSALAADIVVEAGLLSWRKLRLLRHMEWNDFEGPGEPVTGVASSLVTSFGNVFGGIGSVPYRIAKTSHKRNEKKKRRQRIKELRERRKKRAVTNHPPTADIPAEDLHQHVEIKDDVVMDGPDGDISAKDHVKPEGNAKQDDSEANGPVEANGKPKRPLAQGRDTGGTISSIGTASTAEANPVEDYAEDVGAGIGRSAEAFAKAPVDLSMALAQGFHNAPRLYGDDTVRRPPRVTGIQSGLKAAGSEFAYGIYDGTTGLVRLPIRGAKKDGVVGFAKGTGMGAMGFVLKYLSALVGPFGYTMKGIVKQAERHKQPDRIIRRARIVQGQREAKELGVERKEVEKEVKDGWRTMRALWEALEDLEKKKGLRSRLHAKKQRGLHAAFESVDIAQRTLEAVQRGEDVSTVVGTEKELKKEDENPKAADRRRSADTRQSIESSSRRSVDSALRRGEGGGNEKRNGNGTKNMSRRTTDNIPEDADGEAFEDALEKPLEKPFDAPQSLPQQASV